MSELGRCPAHSDGRHIEDWDGSCMGEDCNYRFPQARDAELDDWPSLYPVGESDGFMEAVNELDSLYEVRPAPAPKTEALEQAARLALETLERASDSGFSVECDESIAALRKALEQVTSEAPQPSPAVQGDALDAARYRWLRDGEWRDTDLEPFIRLQLNTLWDAKIDAARAAQEGK